MCRQLKTMSSLLLLFLLIIPSLALAQTAVGKFSFVQGRVDVLRPPAPRAVPVKMGDAVFVGDIVRAKSASKAEITFTDGNIVRVAHGTRVEISEYMFEETKGKGILKLSRGKVQAIVQEQIAKRIAAFGEANRFEIHTPTAILGVRGTNFIVYFLRNDTGVLVLDGAVQAYSLKYPDLVVTVNAGYVTTIPLDQPAQPARPFTDAEKKLHEGDFAPTGKSGEKSEAEDTVISEATTGPAEPGATEPGPESLTPTGTLTEIVQPPPITETVGSDTIPPVITISGPPGLSNLPVSTFNVTSDETVTFTYEMESWGAVSPNTTSDNFNLEGLPDGTYTLTVTATDQAGNSSTASYIWTVDRTPPTFSMTPDAASPEEGTELTTLNIGLSSNEPAIYSYSYTLDDKKEVKGTGSYVSIPNIPEGGHELSLTVQATDIAENTSKPPSLLEFKFDLNRYTLEGSVSGTGSILSGSAKGDVAGVLEESWGGWNISMSGDYGGSSGSSWNVASGGKGYDSPDDIPGNPNGYWLDIATGSYSGTTMTGTSQLTYLTTETLGTGIGTVNGTYGGDTWKVTDTGIEYTEKPLAFGGGISGDFMYWDGEGMSGEGMIEGLMGGTDSLWSGSPSFTALGKYENPNNRTLWSMDIGTEDIPGWTSDEGAFLGRMGGIVLYDELKDRDSLEGRLIGIYIKPTETQGEYRAGYIYSDNIEGLLSPILDLETGIGIYELGGNLTIPEEPTGTITDVSIEHDYSYGKISGDIEGNVNIESFGLDGQNWNIWFAESGGTYDPDISPAEWTADAGGQDEDNESYWIGHITGTDWAGSGRLAATISGRTISYDEMGTFAGNILGVHNIGEANKWQAISGGISAWEPLAFVSNMFTYNDNALAAAMLGGTHSLWTATQSSPAHAAILGAYYNYISAPYTLDGETHSYNYTNASNTTYDGGAYEGYFSITDMNNVLEGRLVALYIAPDGNAGYLKGNLTGTAYPDINMLEMDGGIYPILVVEDIGITPENLYESWEPELPGNGDISGSFSTGGYISSRDEFAVEFGTMSIVDYTNKIPQNWGIYSLEFFGEFSNPGGDTSWTALAGGEEYFGAYTYSDGEGSYLNDDWGYWLANITSGTWDGNKVTGILDERFLTYTKLGTIEGNLLGTYNTIDNTWHTVSLGTWSGIPLTFVSNVSSDIYYYDPENEFVSDGYLNALIGGTGSLWTNPATFTILGQYYPESNNPHIWNAEVYSHNYITGNDTTYDIDGSGVGAYYGYLSGIDRQFNNSVEGRLYALYIDPSGKAGILKGSFGTGDDIGILYPDIEMFEADGKINPVELNPDIGITPLELPAEWFNDPNTLIKIQGPVISDEPNDSGGFFLDNDINIISEITNRGDVLRSVRFANDGFGVWQMESWGSYDSLKTSDTYLLFSDQEWRDEYDNANRLVTVDSFGTWQDGKLSGNALGFWGNWIRGRTNILVGETIGTYNDSLGSFGALTTGARIETGYFLNMIAQGGGRDKLGLLGFPTTEVVNNIYLSGTQPSLPGTSVSLNNMRFYSKESVFGDWPYVWATNSINGSYSGVSLADIGVITVTNVEKILYGRFDIERAEYSEVSNSDNWLAEVWGIGAIPSGSTYIQGKFFGASAGTYTETDFSGSVAGLFYPSTYLSHITTDDNIAYLQTFDSEMGYVSDGYFKGIMGGGDPTPLWNRTEEEPAEFEMIGLYSNEGNPPSYLNHVFSTTIYPKNYTDPSKPYTTTDGGSYFGYLVGIHSDSLGEREPVEGLIGALYIDPSGNAGALMGQFDGYFDVNNSQWWADGDMYPVWFGTATILPSELHNNIDYGYFGSGPVAGDIEGSIEIEGIKFDGQDWEVWYAGGKGTYNDSPPANWEAVAGGYESDDYGNVNDCWIGHITGTDWSSGRLAGTISGMSLDEDEIGIFSGNILGTYLETGGSGTWQAVSLGTWRNEPLAFGGGVGSEFFEWDPIYYLVGVRSLIGLMGVIEGDLPSFVSLGTYDIYSLYDGALWGVDILDSTPDNGALLGFTGGIVKDDSLEGLLAGIFIKDNGETGYIYSDNVTGNLYPEIGMYELDGNLIAVTMGITTVLPSQLYWGSKSLESDEWSFNIAGGINGEVSGSDIKLEEVDPKAHLPWGIWRFTATGSYTDEPEDQWNAVGGYVGYNYEDENVHDYKIYHFTEGSWSSGRLSANVTGRHIHISPDHANTVVEIGSMLGTYDVDTWRVLSAGYYTEKDLVFGGGLGNESFEWDPTYYLVGVRSLTGLIGVTESLWTGTPSFLSLGTYDTDYLYDGALWGVDVSTNIPGGFISEGGALLGVTGGIVLGDNELRDSLLGGLRAIYIKPTETGYETGYIVSSNVSGYLYPDFGMYEIDGNLTAVSMGTTSVLPDNLSWDGFYGDSPSLYLGKEVGTIEGDVEGSIAMQNIGLVDQDWGIWWASGDSYDSEENPPIPPSWTATAEGESFDGDMNFVGIWGSQTIGNRIDIGNKLVGSSTGYFADISSIPITGITVGETLGTFDPNTYTWQAISMGVWLETTKFLQMAGKVEGVPSNIEALQKLKIPCVEVGRANLTGSGNNFSDLRMTDTIFFAPNSGAKPTIWATGNVNGSYSSAPTINTPVGLSGGGLNADFTFKQWDAGNGKWLSSINGTGGFNGSTSFQGAGAGTGATSGSGTISGTGAGTAR